VRYGLFCVLLMLTFEVRCSDNTPFCSPGDIRSCICSEGKPGLEHCTAAGTGFGACQCEESDADRSPAGVQGSQEVLGDSSESFSSPDST